MSYFVIIRGPAAVGKTTIAKALAKSLSGYYISIDDFLRKHKLNIHDEYSIKKQNFLIVNEKIIPEVLLHLKKNVVVVIDGNFYFKEQIEHLIKSIPYDHFVFSLTASVEECLVRESKRHEKRQIGEEGVKAVYELNAKTQHGIDVDVEKKEVSDVIEEIISYLPKKS